MDAKNIFIACSYMKSKIFWDSLNGNEWSFVGIAEDFKQEKVQSFLNEYFDEELVYFVTDKRASCEIELVNATNKLAETFEDEDVIICDKSFRKMVEFNKIGVARHGEVPEITSS